MATMPKHVAVKELKNTLILKLCFFGVTDTLMYQNVRNKL
jgi:hypothetical protein